MAHGLEVRVPLLDHRFVEACASIPSELKLTGFRSKAIFRTAMRGILPDVILKRGKQGYSLPVKNWLRVELRDYFIDTIRSSPIVGDLFDVRYIERLVAEHDGYRANHSHTLWALLNLAVWHRLFIERSRAHRSVTHRMETLAR
jgi:asparagine synthase (glutamine-hydrolysing)